MMKTKTGDDLLIIVLNSITILIHTFYSAYSFIASWLIIFQTCLLVLSLFVHKKIEIRYFFLLFAAVSLAIISVLINGGGSGSILVITNTLLMLHLLKSATCSIRTCKLVFLGYIALNIIWMLKSEVGLYNPNTVGLLAVFGIISMDFILSFSAMSKSMKLILFFVFTLLVFYMIYSKSNSRNSIVVIAVYILIVNFIPSKLLIKKPVYNLIFLILTVGSLIWTRVVVYFYQNSVSIDLFFSDKYFYTGRESIWSEVWRLLKNSWVFGLGTNQSLSSISSFNLHNSMLNLLSAYGVLTTIVFIIFLYTTFKYMVNRLEKYNDRLSKITIVAFISIMLHGFNELTLFSTTFLAPMLITLSFVMRDNNLETKPVKSVKQSRYIAYKTKNKYIKE